MTAIVLEGGHIVTPLEHRLTSIWIDGGRVASLGDRPPYEPSRFQPLDVAGCYVTPGLFDLQVNGGPACNLWADPSLVELDALRRELAMAGVTSFLPTLISDDVDHLLKNLQFLRQAGAGKDLGSKAGGAPSARMPGVHLEGPCLSPERPGVHPPDKLKPLTLPLMEKLAGEEVKLVTLAPELDESGEAVQFLLGRGVRVSLGHSNANFEQAWRAFEQGVSLMTHTFNALPPVHHRAPGAVGAAIRHCLVSCCVICDGLHVDPTMVRILVRLKGVPQMILVSDAAHVGTSQGGLVGSSITLSQAVRNVVEWGVAGFVDAVRMASWNPACAVGLEDRIGHLAPGKLADLVVWDKETLAVRHVFVGGKQVV